MKGYLTGSSFMGWVFDRWMPFSTENEYYEYMEELA